MQKKAIKIEMALIDDFKKLKSRAILSQDVILNDYNEIKNKARGIENEIKKYLNETIDLSKVKDELSSKYKELGLSFESSKEFADFRKAFEKQKEILDMLTKLKSL